jgi:hypothetical protein
MSGMRRIGITGGVLLLFRNREKRTITNGLYAGRCHTATSTDTRRNLA